MKAIMMDIHIDAPVSRVFEVATDLEGLPERVDAVKKVEILTNGPLGVGTRFRETRIMFGKEATEEMEFTSFDPGQGYVIEAESMGSHYTSTIRFTPENEGTRMTWSFGAEPLGTFSRIMSMLLLPLFAGATRRALEGDLKGIKDTAEAGTPEAS